MREKNFKTVLYGGTGFSYMFPRVLPTYSCTRIRKRKEDTFPHVAAEEAKQRHRASKKRHGCKTQRKATYPRTSGFYKNNRLLLKRKSSSAMQQDAASKRYCLSQVNQTSFFILCCNSCFRSRNHSRSHNRSDSCHTCH